MNLTRFALGVIAAGLCAASASACELGVSKRSASAAGYVENAQRCLSNAPAGFTFDEAMEADNLRRVNEARAKNGKPRLSFRPELRDAARWHSMDMAANNFFSHKSKDQRMHDKRVSLLDRSLIYDASRENLAMIRGAFQRGSEHETLHSGLMESPGHKKNILADNVSHAAVGVVRYKNGVWLTQLFVNEAGELSAPAPVRLYPGQTLDLDAKLKTWTFEGFSAEQGERRTAFKTSAIGGKPKAPGGVYGDIVLSTRGERRRPGGGGTYINMSGPEVTMVGTRANARQSASTSRAVTQKAAPASAATPSAPQTAAASSPASRPQTSATTKRPVKRRVTRRTISRKVIS